jgi:tRNA (Thr-GGU) A37 N-methylase
VSGGSYELRPVGRVESPLTERTAAPKQGDEGAPEATIVFEPGALDALDGIEAGDEVIVLTWLDRADRGILRTRPRDDPRNPLQVCSTRALRTVPTRSGCTRSR